MFRNIFNYQTLHEMTHMTLLLRDSFNKNKNINLIKFPPKLFILVESLIIHHYSITSLLKTYNILFFNF